MRVYQTLLILIGSVGLTGCIASSSTPPPSQKWTTGFWFWQDTYAPEEYRGEVDLLYVQIGTLSRDTSPSYVQRSPATWSVWGQLPNRLPLAKEYWLVLRCRQQTVPDVESAVKVAAVVSRVLGEASMRHIHVAGLQLDIDSPTQSLPQYAVYLREARKYLPEGFGLSITGLLDWFRSGTAVAEVVKEVDEFVPQFYDVDFESYRQGSAVGARIDAARYGPAFNRLGKRYRIGISTFGRALLIPGPVSARGSRLHDFGDLVPLDIATNPAFRLETSRNAANELVLTYRATRKVRVSYTDFDAGDTVQFVLATPESVRTAVASARQMQGNLAGVLFFRWPGGQEELNMQPGEVLMAAGERSQDQPANTRIDVVDGRCATVSCVDLYLETAKPLSPGAVQYRVHSSVELEYFLPEKNTPVHPANPSELVVSLPPYCGRGRLYLGRAVTAQPSEFVVEEPR